MNLCSIFSFQPFICIFYEKNKNKVYFILKIENNGGNIDKNDMHE